MERNTSQEHLLSAEGLLDDLKHVRSKLGFDNTGPDGLLATIEVMRAYDNSQTEQQLTSLAKETLGRWVDTLCMEQMNGSDNVCARAAAQSLWWLTVADERPDATKASVLRKKAMERWSCDSLSVDGLRYREDVLMREIAEQAWSHLEEGYITHFGAAFWTTIDQYSDTMLDLADNLERMLERDQHGPIRPPTQLEAAEALHRVGIVHALAVALSQIYVHRRIESHGEAWLASMGFTLMLLPFHRIEDRRAIAAAIPTQRIDPSADSEDFLAAVSDLDPSLPERWKDYLNSCTERCHFGRTQDRSLICPIHQLVMEMRLFVAGRRAYKGHRMDDFLEHIVVPEETFGEYWI